MTFRLLLILSLLSSLMVLAYLRPVAAPKIQDSPRFQKLNALAEPISAWAGPWACVVDTHTGLLWEVKTDNESIHDAYWTYSWFDGRMGQENLGDCYFEKERCDTQDLIQRVNQVALCGRADWRLPTEDELNSLLFEYAKPGEPYIDKGYFPHTKKGDYWTQEAQKALTGHHSHLGFGAVAVNFGHGKVQALPYRNAAFVRLVTKLQ